MVQFWWRTAKSVVFPLVLVFLMGSGNSVKALIDAFQEFCHRDQKVGSSDIRQRLWHGWKSGFMFVALGGLLALTLARWTILAGMVVVAIVLSLTILRFIQNGSRPRFSLKTILLVTGIVACGIVLNMTGDPWNEVHRFPGFETNVAMSPDGDLVAASQGTSIVIRETQTGRAVQTIKMTAAEAAKKVNQKWTFKMGFTKDGKSLMTVDWQTYPSLFNVSNGEVLRGWPTNRGICPLANSGARFIAYSVAATSTGLTVETCNVYDVELVDPILSFESNYMFCRFISPTGSHVLVGKDKSTAELWNVDEQRLLGTIPTPQTSSGLAQFFAIFSLDGKLLAVPTSSGVAVWDVMQCRKVAEWKPQKFDYVTSLEWSPNGSRLVASYIELIGPTHPAALAAAKSGNSTRNAIDHCFLLDKNCREIAPIFGTNATFSVTGDRIATTYGGILIHDGTTGEVLTGVRGRPMGIAQANSAIHFSPDGDWMFVNGDPTVYRRTRTEYWYGIYQIPAFWGMILFLNAMIVQLFESINGGRHLRSDRLEYP